VIARLSYRLLLASLASLCLGNCATYRGSCVSRPADRLDARPHGAQQIVLPLREHRDWLYDWDYVDGSNCDLKFTTRRLVADNSDLRAQALRQDEWIDEWIVSLSEVASICRFRWHTLNPPDALDGMELRLQHRHRGVGKVINLQAVAGVCAETLLDQLESRLREHGSTSLCGTAPANNRLKLTARGRSSAAWRWRSRTAA